MRFRTPLLLLPFCVLAQVSSAQQPAAQPAQVRSPEVLADRRVTFRLTAPKASEVHLTCECVLGQKPSALQKDDKGVWSVTIGPFATDIYEYEFWVDGVQMIDPRNEVVKHNNRPGMISSLLTVPGTGPTFYDARPVPHGAVDIRWYQSKVTNTARRAYIYTPANYDRSSSRLPVLYLLHGADGDETAWTAFGKANHILDNLIAEKRAAPMVVVMPFGYAYSWDTNVAAEKQQADFQRDLLEELIPYVQANYRVHTDRDHRALAGLSRGGGQTLTIGLRHLDLFSRLGVFSSSGNPDAFKDVAADAKKVNERVKLFWMGIGTGDPGFQNAKRFSDFLDAAGITHTFFTIPNGEHTWIMWRRFLQETAPKLWPTPSSTN